MNIFRPSILAAMGAVAALLLAAGLFGCDVGSIDSTTAQMSDNKGNIYNFAGLYMSPSSDTNSVGTLVYPEGRQSGVPLTWLRLLQYGSVLEAYDNANQRWNGKISSIQGSSANFSLRGRTSAGLSTEIVGTMIYEKSTSTIDAAWIEPAFAGTFIAKATVAPASTNNPVVGDLTLAPATATLSSTNKTQVFTASGGTGSYTWSHNSSCGELSATSGSSITYTWKSAGSDYVSVTSSGKTKTAIVTCQ